MLYDPWPDIRRQTQAEGRDVSAAYEAYLSMQRRDQLVGLVIAWSLFLANVIMLALGIWLR